MDEDITVEVSTLYLPLVDGFEDVQVGPTVTCEKPPPEEFRKKTDPSEFLFECMRSTKREYAQQICYPLRDIRDIRHVGFNDNRRFVTTTCQVENLSPLVFVEAHINSDSMGLSGAQPCEYIDSHAHETMEDIKSIHEDSRDGASSGIACPEVMLEEDNKSVYPEVMLEDDEDEEVYLS